MLDRPVHPAAAVFPMLPEDELRELAEDIKANGLLHPITIDKDGMIVDGRNRDAACRMADVEPRYEPLNGHDPVAFILSANVRRRHMSKGQTAMAMAMMIETEEGKRDGQTKALRFESNLSRSQITRALTIRRYAPDLAPGVLAGTEAFDTAYSIAQARKRERDEKLAAADRAAHEDAIELERLRRLAPDLAALVPDSLTVAEAKQTLVQREERARAERESKARVAETVCGWLDPGLRTTSEERAEAIVSTLDAQALATRPDFSAARFARCVETLAAIARRLEAKETSR